MKHSHTTVLFLSCNFVLYFIFVYIYQNQNKAFVNFVDYKDIIPFVEKYNGCGWTRFNSDKICDITYARIQGKAAMLKRFENSSLMEKDDEYRPKVFVSHGERKGQVESIPRSSSGY